MITIVIKIVLLLLEVVNVFGTLLCGSGADFRIGDYGTIDWVHDSVKDQFRKKKLRSMTGLRGL